GHGSYGRRSENVRAEWLLPGARRQESLRRRRRLARHQSRQESNAYHHGALLARLRSPACRSAERKPLMAAEGISRRDVLRSLVIGATAGSVLRVIPAEAAAYVHDTVAGEKAGAGKYTPKFFSASQYATLTALCDAIIPKDDRSGGAVEAGAPEFVDLLT